MYSNVLEKYNEMNSSPTQKNVDTPAAQHLALSVEMQLCSAYTHKYKQTVFPW